MSSIQRNSFGRLGWDVSKIGIGTYHLTTDRGVRREEALNVIRKARALGVNLFDTAPLYGCGESDGLLGEAFCKAPRDYRIIAKVGRFEVGTYRNVWKEGYRSPFIIRSQFEQTLRQLGRESVDLLLLHESDWEHWWNEEEFQSGTGLSVLEKLKKDGLTEGIGLSLRNSEIAKRLIKTGKFDAMLFVHFCNMIWQESLDDVMPIASQNGLGISVGAVFKQGLLIDYDEADLALYLKAPPRDVTAGIIKRMKAVLFISRESGICLPELGLRFLLSVNPLHSVIVGPANVKQLEQNVEWAIKGKLPVDVLSAIRNICKIPLGEERNE